VRTTPATTSKHCVMTKFIRLKGRSPVSFSCVVAMKTISHLYHSCANGWTGSYDKHFITPCRSIVIDSSSWLYVGFICSFIIIYFLSASYSTPFSPSLSSQKPIKNSKVVCRRPLNCTGQILIYKKTKQRNIEIFALFIQKIEKKLKFPVIHKPI